MTDPAVRAQIRQARGKFAAMAVTYSMGAFNDNFFKQAAMLLAIRHGLPQLQGWAAVIFALPFIVLAAPAGWLADRFSKRTVVIAAKALELAAMVCGAAGICLGSWLLILLMITIMGAQSAIFSPSLNGSIPELYPPSHVTAANGIVKMCVTAAILLGVALAGLALDVGGTVAGMAGGRLAVAVVVLAVAAAGLAGSFGVPRNPAAAPNAPFPWTALLDTARTLGQVARDRLFLKVLAADVFVWFLGALQILMINLLGEQQLHYSHTATSALAAAEMIGIAAGGVLSAQLAKGRRWFRVLAPAAFGIAVAMFLVPAAAALPAPADGGVDLRYLALWVVLAAGGAAGGLLLIPCESFIQVRPPADRKGAVIASANCAAFVGILLAGLVSMGLEALMSPSASFAALGIVSLAAGAGLLWALRKETGE